VHPGEKEMRSLTSQWGGKKVRGIPNSLYTIRGGDVSDVGDIIAAPNGSEAKNSIRRGGEGNSGRDG